MVLYDFLSLYYGRYPSPQQHVLDSELGYLSLRIVFEPSNGLRQPCPWP